MNCLWCEKMGSKEFKDYYPAAILAEVWDYDVDQDCLYCNLCKHSGTLDPGATVESSF